MKRATIPIATVWLLLAGQLFAQAPVSVLTEIPSDARGFVVLAGLEQSSEKVHALATRFQIPAPKLVDLVLPYEKGLNQRGNAALAWLPAREGDDAQSGLMHFVLYIPVSDYKAFVGQLGADGATAGISEVTLDSQSLVVAQKGNFAAVAPAEDRGSLEHVLSAKQSISDTTKPLHDWLNENDVSIALSRTGTKLLFAKLKEGLNLIRAGVASVPGGNAEMIDASLQMYEGLFESAGNEFDQLAIGLRIDPKKSISIHKRILLSREGSWAKGPELERPIRSLVKTPAGPFLFAFEGAMPTGVSKGLMAQSFNMLKTMQGPDAEPLSDAQVEELSEIAAESMQGVHSMAFNMGVGEPGSSMYSRMSGLMHVDDSDAFMKRYADAIKKMSSLVKDAKIFGAYEFEDVTIDDKPAVHLTMDMSSFSFGGADSPPELKQYMESLFGPDGKLSVYIAAADTTTVMMAYVSPENLTRSIAAYQGRAKRLGTDAQLKITADQLPGSSHWVGYLSPGGVIEFASQMMETFAPGLGVELPDFPASPPIGFAAELKPEYLDGRLVIPVETIDAIIKFVFEVRSMGTN